MELTPYFHLTPERLYNLYSGDELAWDGRALPGTESLRSARMLPGEGDSSRYRENLLRALGEFWGNEGIPEMALDVMRNRLLACLQAVGDDSLNLPAMFGPVFGFLQREPERGAGLEVSAALASLGRPGVRHDLEQLPCTLYSSQQRAGLASGLGRRILLLGDDDLGSLFLPEAEVLELDSRLLDFLGGRGVRARRQDFRTGLPSEDLGQYDVVVTDPPYQSEGFLSFLECARLALRAGGSLLLSTNRGMLQSWLDWPELGFQQRQHWPNFNRYPMPPELVDSHVFHGARYGIDPELGRLVFGPPFFYSDLYLLTLA